MDAESIVNYGAVTISTVPSRLSKEDIANASFKVGRLVQLESPFSPSNGYSLEHNLRYARAALRDSIMREETPFASHLLYTQEGVLDDEDPIERKIGIRTGFRFLWNNAVSMSVIYADYGLSRGMIEGIRVAIEHEIPIEFRFIETEFESSWERLSKLEELMRKVAYS